MRPRRRLQTVTAIAAMSAAMLLLDACGGTAAQPGTDHISSGAGAPVALPAGAAHIHGMAISGSATLLATHDGLWSVDGGGVEQIGESEIDLMGFTVAGPSRFYSSGHPHGQSELQNPVGLIESVDGGQTWNYLSRGGRSDFHAMAAAGNTVYGFDDALQLTKNGKTWVTQNTTVQPASLAVSSKAPSTLLAATQQGLQLSTDAGKSFLAVPDAPLLQLVTWPEGDVVWGVGPGGQVYVSHDGAVNWEPAGSVGTAPAAMSAAGTEQVSVATSDGVFSSTDGGRNFTQIATTN